MTGGVIERAKFMPPCPLPRSSVEEPHAFVLLPVLFALSGRDAVWFDANDICLHDGYEGR